MASFRWMKSSNSRALEASQVVLLLDEHLLDDDFIAPVVAKIQLAGPRSDLQFAGNMISHHKTSGPITPDILGLGRDKAQASKLIDDTRTAKLTFDCEATK